MADNKLIVKNSLFLAGRMLLSMAISLYTSRVILQQLGVTDFGIYNVIGGLCVIMSFFTGAMTTAIQRFMNVELGKTGPRDMQQVFSACWVCVIAVAVVFVMLAETAGLWFLDNELSIPADRMTQARIVMQMSLAIVVIEIMRVPYNSLIIAYERMSFYAYNSILESVLKLATAIALSLIGGDKLIIYMWLLIGVAVIINWSFVRFCNRNIPRVRFSLRAPRQKVTEIGRFAGWNVLMSVAEIAYNQGAAMILNIFYGVAFNATMGISNQVKTAVSSFTRSVQIAANPPIVKTWAANETDEFRALVGRISRISYFLVLVLGLPIIINAPYILSLWLTVIPPSGVVFVRLMVVFCIIDSLTGPLWTAMLAAGRIAVYQIVTSVLWVMSLPLIYLAFHEVLPPQWLLIVLIGLNSVILVVRLVFSKVMGVLSAADFLKTVVARIAAVTVIAGIAPVVVATMMECGMARLLVTTAVTVLTMLPAIYLLGIDRSERAAIKKFIFRHSSHE